jgi:hypothetical protein
MNPKPEFHVFEGFNGAVGRPMILRDRNILDVGFRALIVGIGWRQAMLDRRFRGLGPVWNGESGAERGGACGGEEPTAIHIISYEFAISSRESCRNACGFSARLRSD